MKKNFILKLISYLILLIVPIFWLLSRLTKAFKWFNFSIASGIILCSFGLIIVTKNIINKRHSAYKRLSLIISCIFEIIAVICFVIGFALPKNIIAPIIFIIIACVMLISLFITYGGTKWDEGDNHKQGYKKYDERKELKKDNNL